MPISYRMSSVWPTLSPARCPRSGEPCISKDSLAALPSDFPIRILCNPQGSYCQTMNLSLFGLFLDLIVAMLPFFNRFVRFALDPLF